LKTKKARESKDSRAFFVSDPASATAARRPISAKRSGYRGQDTDQASQQDHSSQNRRDRHYLTVVEIVMFVV